MLWHVDPFARQRPRNKQLCNIRCSVTAPQTNMFPWQQLHCNRRRVFSTRSFQRCYKQGQLAAAVGQSVSELVRGLLRFSRYELLLLEAISCRVQFGNPEEGERPMLEAATQQRQ
jgi:hypothetical protein